MSRVTDVAPAEAEAKEDEGGGWRRTSWVMSLSSASSISWSFAEVRGTEGGAWKRKVIVVSNLPSCQAGECPRQGIQSEASVVQSFWEACEEGLCGIVGTTGPVLEVKGRRVQLAVDDFSMSSSF